MNTTNHTPSRNGTNGNVAAHNNGAANHSLNGNGKRGSWLPGRVERARKANGSYEGEAQASRDSQWGKKFTGNIPETNFGMKEDKTAELVSAAHAAASIGKPIEDVRRRGLLMFDSTWAHKRGAIEANRNVARREISRMEADRAVQKTEQDATPRMVVRREGRLEAPCGWWGRIGFLAIALGLVTVLACEWMSAATLRKFELQDLGKALLLTSPFVAFALATKLLLRRDSSPRMRIIQIAFHCVGVAAVGAWLTLLAMNYGTALRDDFELPSKTATIAFTLAQFLAALAGSSWLTMLLASLFTPATTVLPNADWERMANEIQKLDRDINRQLLISECEQAELDGHAASRDAWVAIGEEAYERSRQRLQLIQDKIDFLDGN